MVSLTPSVSVGGKCVRTASTRMKVALHPSANILCILVRVINRTTTTTNTLRILIFFPMLSTRSHLYLLYVLCTHWCLSLSWILFLLLFAPTVADFFHSKYLFVYPYVRGLTDNWRDCGIHTQPFVSCWARLQMYMCERVYTSIRCYQMQRQP